MRRGLPSALIERFRCFIPLGVKYRSEIGDDLFVVTLKRHSSFVVAIVPKRENAGFGLVSNPDKSE